VRISSEFGVNAMVPALHTLVRTLKVITIAMLMGLVMVAAVSAFTLMSRAAPQGGGADDAWPVGINGAAAVVFLIAGVAASFVLPGMVARARAAKDVQPLSEGHAADGPRDDSALARTYQTAHVVRLALLEGPGMLLCVAAIVEQSWLCLGLVLIPMALIAASTPNEERLHAWLESQRMLSQIG
jgi:hypothetical protein